MVSMGGTDIFLTTWGMREGKQVWRCRWNERPGMLCDITGPWDTTEAFLKLHRTKHRLPWVTDPDPYIPEEKK